VCFENILTGCAFILCPCMLPSTPANMRQPATSRTRIGTSSWTSTSAPTPRIGRPSRRPRS
jgi:hypothetical protein